MITVRVTLAVDVPAESISKAVHRIEDAALSTNFNTPTFNRLQVLSVHGVVVKGK